MGVPDRSLTSIVEPVLEEDLLFRLHRADEHANIVIPKLSSPKSLHWTTHIILRQRHLSLTSNVEPVLEEDFLLWPHHAIKHSIIVFPSSWTVVASNHQHYFTSEASVMGVPDMSLTSNVEPVLKEDLLFGLYRADKHANIVITKLFSPKSLHWTTHII